jgi:hypothetical protein
MDIFVGGEDSPGEAAPFCPSASRIEERKKKKIRTKKLSFTLFAALTGEEGRPAQRSRGESSPAFKTNVCLKPNT